MRRIALGFSLLLLFILVAGYWLLGSEAGNRRLIAWSLGDNLQVERLRGSLLSGHLELRALRYRAETQSLAIPRLRLDWRPRALLQGQLHIELLQLEGARFESSATGEEENGRPPEIPRLPLDLRLDRLQLTDLEVIHGDSRWQVAEIGGGLATLEQTLKLSQIQVRYREFTAEAAGEVGLSERLPVTLELSWQGRWPEIGPLRGRGTLNGDLQELRLDHRVSEPVELTTRGNLKLGEVPTLDLAGEWSALRWPLAGEDPQFESQQGHYQLTGPIDRIRVEVEGDLQVPDAPFARQLNVTGVIQEDGLRETELRATLETGQVALRGEVLWSPAVTWALQITGENLDPALLWPEWPGALQLQSRLQGGIREGEPWSTLQLQRLAGTVRDRPLLVQGELEYADNRLAPLALSVESGPSRLALEGRVNLAPAPAWDLRLTGEQLDPAIGWPQWPGELALDARLQGGLRAQEPWLEVTLNRLAGTLRQQPLTAQGEASYNEQGLVLEGVEVDSGPNRLRLDGQLAETLALNFKLDAPKLAASWAGLSGRLQGDGQLTGSQQAPNLEVKLTGERLAYGEHAIGQLEAAVRWSREQATGDILARELQVAGQQIKRLEARLRGDQADHRAEIELDAPAGQLETRLNGGWSDGQWAGALQALSLEHPTAGRWSLVEPVGLQVAADAGSLQTLCLRRELSQLCASADWGAEEQRVNAELNRLPLQMIRPYMPDQGRIEGFLDGSLALQGPLGTAYGEALLTLRDAALLVDATEQGGPLRLGVETGRFNVQSTASGLTGKLDLRFSEGGEVAGNLALATPAGDQPHPLSGQFTAALPDIAPLELFVPSVSELQGRLEGALRLSGTLPQPQLEGNLQLQGGGARVPGLGLALTEADFGLQTRGNRQLVLNGSLRSGPGRLQLDGSLSLDAEQGWPMELKLQGERVQVARLPEYEVYVSPDLSLRLSRERLKLTGVVEVPEARIEIREVPENAVKVSEDEVIVGAERPETTTQPPLIDARLTLRVGDEVHFSGFGLTSRLQGELVLRSSEQRYQANGELYLREGRYKAYGQDLSIEEGRLDFVGPPDNPNLDIQATRLSQDREVTAILDVQGTLRNPRVTVSSEPSLPEEEALAYLVTGRGLGEGGGSSAALLRQAALAQGLDRSQDILASIAQGIGADELKVEEGATLEDTSLLLGKYLSPNLYVSYGVGLFDKQSALMMRYKLSEHLRLEVQSGSQQGVDLFYDIEHD